MKDYLYIDSSDDAHQAKFKVSKTPKVEYLIKEKRYDEALNEINDLLKTDEGFENLNLKAVILDGLSMYEESCEFFDRAYRLNPSDEIQLNKANTLYDWAKVTFFPEGDYEKAIKLIDDALDTIPDGEDASEYYFLKAEILEALNQLVDAQKYYLMAHKQFDKVNELESQINYLNSTEDTLINVVGTDFHDFTPQAGMIVDLIKEEDNEHDPDAIAVFYNEKMVGYVANSDYTLIDEVKSASKINQSIKDNQKAEILFIYLGEYVIAKLI
jgi:tetratricopeptide (TPR) repeat protein